MPSPELDRVRLQQALALAETSYGLSDPNPRVGCVIGTEDGRIVGRGATQQVGGPHAEVMALREAAASARGATAWVTLEPCAHHGRTPPCCDALIDAGIARVVVAAGDPFAQVAGAGLARLRAAGVAVVMAEANIARAARDVNIGFFSSVLRGRPWLRLKIAVSLDGRSALPDGRSQWITGPAARADGHAWRRRAGAVLTGVGTVLADDPRLDVRLVPTTLHPLRVVLDSKLRMPAEARLLSPPGRVLVATRSDDATHAARLTERGAEVVRVAGDDGRVDVAALIAHLAERGIHEIHAEAGPRLNAALLGSGLVDELLIYQAPIVVGAGRGIADLGPLAELSVAPRFVHVEATPIDGDLRIRARHPDSARLADGLWPPRG